MSPPETWTIILQSEAGGGDGAAGGSDGATDRGETPNQRKNLFEDAGKVFGAIASSAGILALLIRTIYGSTVFSTFFDAFMKVLSALADLFLVAFIPLFMVVLQWLLSLLPVAKRLGEALEPLIKMAAEALKEILTAITDWIVPRLFTLVDAITAFATTGDISPLLAWGEKFFKDLFEIASKLFTDFIEWIKTNGPEIVASIGKSVTLFAEWLKTEGPNIVKTIVDGIKVVQATLDPLFKQIVAVLGPIVLQFLAPLGVVFDKFMIYLKDIFKIVLDDTMVYAKQVTDVFMVFLKDSMVWLLQLTVKLMAIALDPLAFRKAYDMNKEIVKAWDSVPELGKIPSLADSAQKTLEKIEALPLPNLVASAEEQNVWLAKVVAQLEKLGFKLDKVEAAAEKGSAGSITNSTPPTSIADPAARQTTQPSNQRWLDRQNGIIRASSYYY